MKSKIQFLALVLLGIMLSINQVWAESKTITPSAVSGDVVAGVISYSTAKNGGTSNPAFSSNAIRLYQNSSADVSNGTRGGSITFTAASGYVINQVTITNQDNSDCNGGTVAYQKNGTGSWLESATVAKGTNYSTGTNLGATSVEIACFGTTNKKRLYITSITVVYASSGGSTYTVIKLAPSLALLPIPPHSHCEWNGRFGGIVESWIELNDCLSVKSTPFHTPKGRSVCSFCAFSEKVVFTHHDVAPTPKLPFHAKHPYDICNTINFTSHNVKDHFAFFKCGKTLYYYKPSIIRSTPEIERYFSLFYNVYIFMHCIMYYF